jgi:hypothetical protein
MAENDPDSQFNRQCRLQFPLGRCESATNSVIVPRRFLHRKPPPVGMPEIPVSSHAIAITDVPTAPITPGTVYNITDPDSGIFSFGYGSTTTSNLVVFHLAVRNQNHKPLLLLLPVTAAVDIATVPVWLWLFSKVDEADDDLFHHHRHHPCKQPGGQRYFDGD